MAPQHCRVFSRPDSSGKPTYYVEDIGSQFGTFVNGKRLNPNEPQLLQERDEIALAMPSTVQAAEEEQYDVQKNFVSYVFESEAEEKSRSRDETVRADGIDVILQQQAAADAEELANAIAGVAALLPASSSASSSSSSTASASSASSKSATNAAAAAAAAAGTITLHSAAASSSTAP